MKNRSEIITEYEGESSAEDRLNAWQGGFRMIAAHPVVGVGVGSYHVALPHYIESRPMVAHNTFIQFSAESGVFAGMAYLALVSMVFLNYFRIASWCRKNPDHEHNNLVLNINNACTLSFAGLIVCSSFLSLNYFEVFFFLMLLSNSLHLLCVNEKGE
jgi:O-antigen ligase